MFVHLPSNAVHALVAPVLSAFKPLGYKLRREMFVVLWGKGTEQKPHMDGHFYCPQRHRREQVDDALSVLIYLSDRELGVCTAGEDIRLSVHAGDAVVMTSRTWHRGLASTEESGVVFISLDRSHDTASQSEVEFFQELDKGQGIPEDYRVGIHVRTGLGCVPSHVMGTLKAT
jgi:hypothetical protein